MIYRFSVLAPVLVLSLIPLVLSTQTLNGGTGMEFVTPELPRAALGRGYEPAPLEVRIGGRCPLGGIGYAVMGGKLPPGLQFSRLGYFSGTASRAGSYDFVIRAANGCSVAMKQFTIVVSAAPLLTVTPAHLIFVAAEHDGSPEQSLLVSATWPDLPYNITIAGGDWLTALPELGRSPGVSPSSAPSTVANVVSSVAGDTVHIRIHCSNLSAGHYSATLTFSAWQAAPSGAVVVELTVLGK
jgi:putative Ig domain-containing protein